MIQKHTGRWMWQGSTLVVSWNWEKYSCHSMLVSTLKTKCEINVCQYGVSVRWRHVSKIWVDIKLCRWNACIIKIHQQRLSVIPRYVSTVWGLFVCIIKIFYHNGLVCNVKIDVRRYVLSSTVLYCGYFWRLSKNMFSPFLLVLYWCCFWCVVGVWMPVWRTLLIFSLERRETRTCTGPQSYHPINPLETTQGRHVPYFFLLPLLLLFF